LIIIIIILLIQSSYFININSRVKNDNLFKQDLYTFIRHNIPDNVEILIPFRMEDFRFRTGKISFIDIKFFQYDPNSLVKYNERYNDLFGNVPLEFTEEKYNSINKKDIDYLKKKYNIKYALFEKPKSLDFNIVFENKKYVLYSIY